MNVTTYHYDPSTGWNRKPDASLDSSQTLVLIFGAADQESISPGLETLRANFPGSRWIGCSSAGEVYGNSIYDGSLAVAVIHFEKVGLKTAITPVQNAQDSARAARSIADALKSPDLRAVLVLADGLEINGSDLVEGLQNHLPENTVITGGLAADGSRFQKTWVIVDRQPACGYVTAIGFYGDGLGFHHGFRGGWDMVGPERIVTRSSGNVLYQMDDIPALDIYRRYLGERAEGLPATGMLFPLAIRNENPDEEPTVRTLLKINERERSITFAGNIPEGARVQLMHANFERLLDAAAVAAHECSPVPEDGRPVLCVAISCVGRRLVLGERTEEEIETTLDNLPASASLIGYYSYGEISPLANGRSHLHNQTMTLTVLWEE